MCSLFASSRFPVSDPFIPVSNRFAVQDLMNKAVQIYERVLNDRRCSMVGHYQCGVERVTLKNYQKA